VVSAKGYAVAREVVRLATPTDRPAEVKADEKWVHFNLPEQSMVAYEGDTPVFATLIASGKKGHDTPTGTHRLYLKYISDRMSGDDPKDGPYDIGEVPWVMYYKNSFAVHGAYWHDGFGKVRSHGCTNLAPADARWLYFWTEPTVPHGWHGQFAAKGTTFHFTRPGSGDSEG
jgi:lipoprotein-anchoring transpeptidase ErfK/SrfK